MTLRFVEGFEVDRSTGYHARKYASASSMDTYGTGRLHGFALTTSSANWTTRSLGSQNTWTIGIGMLHFNATVSASTTPQIIIRRGVNEQLRLEFEKGVGNTFHFKVMRGSTSLGVTSDFTALNWHYFEFEVTIDPVNGAFEFRENGLVDLIDAGPVNTADDGVAGADVFDWQINNSNFRVDDIYILDDQGSINNTFLGDSVVEGRLPTGDGFLSQWTPVDPAGAHWANLDDAAAFPEPGTTSNNSIIETSTISNIDLLTFSALTFITGQIHVVQLMAHAKLDVAGTRTARHKIRSGGSNFDGSSFVVNSTAFQTFFDLVETDPNTGVKWTIANLNAAEFGVELVS
jgi:hypothetical protein